MVVKHLLCPKGPKYDFKLVNKVASRVPNTLTLLLTKCPMWLFDRDIASQSRFYKFVKLRSTLLFGYFFSHQGRCWFFKHCLGNMMWIAVLDMKSIFSLVLTLKVELSLWYEISDYCGSEKSIGKVSHMGVFLNTK